ncbi:MAG TPA: TonB-dependent receptor [Flavisolibacter sp.]|nr:TonB-dependent receptor [Flavisolibacter sp.]
MRYLSFLLTVLLVSFGASAQTISGVAKEAGGQPLSGATISLYKDSAIAKLAVTKENGAYKFEAVQPGTYRVGTSFVGTSPAFSAPFTVGTTDVTVPELIVTKAGGNLQGVTVTARRPVVEVKADKMIVNVEGTINSTGSDALELLRKSPSVMVDKDDNLSVSGKNGVQVYVDGRPTPLSGADLANYLKTLQASQIEAIEIITNPSARYEAAGNAGIINIKLKKNKNYGANGSVNAGFNQGVYAKYNAGVSLNYRNKNVNLFGTYNYNNSKNQNKFNIERSLLDTLFDQRSTGRFNNNSHSFKGGIDLTLNKQSTLGAIVNGTFADPEMRNFSRTPITYKPTNTVDRILEAQNYGNMERNNINFNVNYIYTGKDGKSLVLNADHGIYDLNTNQLQPNNYYKPDGKTLISSVVYRMITPTEINISSFKADYEQNFAKGKLGFGGKIAYVSTDNNFQRFDVYGNIEEYDRDRSNRFKYTENINAGYVNYNRALKGMMIQAGLRVENTISEGTSTGLKLGDNGYESTKSTFRRPYTDFFPSAAITFNKNPMKQWNLTYSRRIDRPAYQDLNPFEFKIDEYTFQKGNINLRPQYTNSFGLTHTYKYKLNVTANYSHVKDIFTQLIDTAERSKAFMTKQNLATQDIVSLNASYPFSYKRFTSFMNMNTNYSQYKANFGAGRKIDLNAFGLSFFTQNSMKLGKDKSWTAELTGFYNAPTVYQGAFKAKSMWGVDAGVQKQILKGQGTVKASFSDLFKSMRFRGTNEFVGQVSKFTGRWESQQLKLNFSYRFGNKQVKAARQRATGAEEEAKRTQGGNGGIGIGQ